MTYKTFSLSLSFKKNILLDQNIDTNDFITLDKINLVYQIRLQLDY